MSDNVLTLACTVPDAALLGHAARRLRALTDAAGGVWFDAGDLASQGGEVWPARNTDARALPIFPDESGPETATLFGGRSVLQLVTARNTGFRLANAVPQDGDWLAAILWHPASKPDKTRTLLSLRAGQGKNYAFLAEQDSGKIELRDDNMAASITIRRSTPGWQLTMIGNTQGRLRLSDPVSGAAVEAANKVAIGHATDLLIGCRSSRKGMPQSLGAARIAAVWLWPGTDAQDELAKALADYWFWEVA